jgi:hypothetical protein
MINMLDEIIGHMDGFSSAEEAWLSIATETLRTRRYVMHETYESPEDNKDDYRFRSCRKRKGPTRPGFGSLEIGTNGRRCNGP